MLQIKSITDVRASLPSYVRSRTPTIIIQNSTPQSVLMPYTMYLEMVSDDADFAQLQALTEYPDSELDDSNIDKSLIKAL